ncbi:hypothetical protein H2201_008469 [Coniosporium apollinis]|uniref:F-box domain-containing protein n=1 Tax=Coniosporium apollinis TaxID=61459 RepID=A0ABQ9NIV7_9PEZI|nr:hypothetical protein H2201_008469 [Coniosporium apollinis]
MWYQPPYLELCPDHVKVNDLPTYIDQMPPELMSSVFELLFPDTDHSIAGDPSWSTVQDPSWRLDGGDIAAQSILGVSRKWNAIATERMKPLTPEINVTTEEVRMFRGRIRARCDRPDWQLPDLAKSVRLERFGTFDVLIYYTRDEPPLGPASVEDLQFVRLVLHIQMVVAMLRGLPQAVRHLRVNFLVRNVDTGVTADTLLEWAVLLFEPFRGLGNVQQAVVGRVGFLDAANECAVPEAPDQTLTARGRSRLAEYSTEWSGDVQSGVESDTLGWTEAMLQVWMKDARIVNRLRESLKELTPSGATNGTSLDILRRHLSGMRTLQLRCAVACLRKDISGFRRAVLKKELLVDHHRATLELVKKLHHDQTELVLNRQKRLKAAIEELEQQDREGQSEEDALRVTTAANEAL